MKKAWFHLDPEAGLQRDEFGGTFVYEDSGKTLADDSPESYFQGPLHLAWILDIVDAMRGLVARRIYRHYTVEKKRKVAAA